VQKTAVTTAKGSCRFVTLVPAQFVRPALEDFAGQIDGQALAAGIQDGFDVGELVPSANLEALAQQADPHLRLGRCPPRAETARMKITRPSAMVR